MTPDGTGSVCVNTTTPGGKLTVGGSFATAIDEKSNNYTVTENDCVLICNGSGGPITISLPSSMANTKGRQYTFKRINTGAAKDITISGNGFTIDGAASKKLTVQYDCLTVISDGDEWFSIGKV